MGGVVIIAATVIAYFAAKLITHRMPSASALLLLFLFVGMGLVGFLVVLIRLFGGFPEGTMYAILLMNAATPLLDRRTQPLPFGRKKSS